MPKKIVKKTKKSKAWYQKKYSVGDIALKAYNMAIAMKEMINCEKHFFDISQNPTTLATAYAGNVIQLVAPTESDDYNGRTGRSILYKGTRLKLKFVINPSATSTNVRVMIVKDVKSIGTNPTITDILETGAAQNATLSPRLASAQGRFVVMYDNTFNMQTVNISSKELLINIRKTFHMKFNTSSSNPSTNALFMLIVSDEITNVPTFSYYGRSWFYDN